MRIEAARRYAVPVERAFAFITDLANWPSFWPGYVRLEPGSSWGAPGDTAKLVTRILGRERTLTMTITELEPNRRVVYTSTQPGLPDARHEGHFEADDGGGSEGDRWPQTAAALYRAVTRRRERRRALP